MSALRAGTWRPRRGREESRPVGGRGPCGPEPAEGVGERPRGGMQTLLVRLVALLGLMSRLLETSALTGAPWGRASRVFLSPSQVKDRRLGLKVKDSNFTLGGFPSLILAGTIHYFRVPKEYWRDRLLKLKACGFNTVTTHVPWNLHEPRRGQFQFTGNLDLAVFISMALEVDLWVILCPGPYIGSDLDLGGLPSWLLRDPKMKLRTTYKGFTKAVNHYFDELIPRIVSLQVQEDGPIIAVQLENEYGSYHMDKKYMPYVKKALVTRGVKTLLMTADTGQDLTGGHVKNVLATLHLRSINKATYETLSSFQGPSPVLMTVYTASAPDGWGALRHSLDPHLVMRDAREMLAFRFSLNFYMFHGGTNFGFMGGSAPLHNYLSTVTSYDYGALLTEDGDYTPEYVTFQELFRSVTVPSHNLSPNEVHRPPQPESRPRVVYKPVAATYYMSLWDALPYLDEPTLSAKPVSMEKLSVNQGSGQSSGYILYETAISSGGLLTSRGHVQDRGQVFLDNLYIGVLDHASTELTLPRRSDYEGSQMLRILVENQGRLAYGPDINKERKGLTGDIYLNKSPLRKFKIYSLEMKPKFIQRDLPNIWKPALFQPRGPAFFLGLLRVGDHPRDTFIKMQDWTKGVIFINGQNLGRYWNIGPQETLYLPGPWLQPGANEIVVFEEWKSALVIQFTDSPQLGHVSWDSPRCHGQRMQGPAPPGTYALFCQVGAWDPCTQPPTLLLSGAGSRYASGESPHPFR
ncbi:beta-galactosidase-1-like protein 2 isoform X2 [Camelus ferus]|uniref:Beta-galactosidase-1-like protein 2 isoform X2 n=2 Tax=Camelus TaxID=9836 RepID=A0A8B8SEF7_CAMFR|nr:beta-galactosidase-1-like protein 2 isoform X2 [Camelus ferus]